MVTVNEKQIKLMIEDAPKEWEEGIALNLRRLYGPDKENLKVAMQHTTNRLNNYFKKYNLGYVATTDNETYINIDDYKKLVIKKNGDITTLSIFNYSKNDEDNVFIEISPYKGFYLITYENSTHGKWRARYNIDSSVLEELFRDVFQMNNLSE